MMAEETDCRECRCFVWCESEKQMFHRVTGIPCDEFEKGSEADE